MLSIRLASDLHLEGYAAVNTLKLADRFIPPDAEDKNSVLVLAGDISSSSIQLYQFLAAVQPRFKAVIYVPGNHEFYGSSFEQWRENLNSLERTYGCLAVIRNDGHEVGQAVIDGVRFLHTTLWADCEGDDELSRLYVGKGLRDFYVITREGRRFTAEDMVKLHQTQQAELLKLLDEPFDGKTVVVTHHLPSYRLIDPQYAGSKINGGFASNSDHLMEGPGAPALWLFGHTHTPMDMQVGETRCICNPMGYGFERNEERGAYKPTFIDIL